MHVCHVSFVIGLSLVCLNYDLSSWAGILVYINNKKKWFIIVQIRELFGMGPD